MMKLRCYLIKSMQILDSSTIATTADPSRKNQPNGLRSRFSKLALGIKLWKILLILLFLWVVPADAQENLAYQQYLQDIERKWMEEEQKKFQEFQRQQQQAFQNFQSDEDRAYQQFVKEVEEKWNQFLQPSPQKFVDYSSNKDTRVTIEFGSGAVSQAEESKKTQNTQTIQATGKTKETRETEKTERVEQPRSVQENQKIKEVEKTTEVKRTEEPRQPEKAEQPRLDEEPKAIEETKETEVAEPTAPGRIQIETLVPAAAQDLLEKAKEKISEQMQKIFDNRNPAKTNILEDLVQTEDGQPVILDNLKQFINEKILPKIKVDRKPVRSRDGVDRIKVAVEMEMVPNHLRVRAKKYLPLISKHAEEYQVDPVLILAVMETESSFNPLAKSHIPAYGLMQIVPKYAGRDAYRYIHKKDKQPSAFYLYIPENNISLGTAYLRILREDYFYGIKDPLVQEYMIIAAYNGGMGRVIKRVLKRYQIPQMTREQVFQALVKEMPDETKDYLRKVTQRKEKYRLLAKAKG